MFAQCLFIYILEFLIDLFFINLQHTFSQYDDDNGGENSIRILVLIIKDFYSNRCLIQIYTHIKKLKSLFVCWFERTNLRNYLLLDSPFIEEG